jgi:hypothetical protein
MKTFKEYFINLQESVSDIAWHYSNNPYQILKSNEFGLSSETGPDITKSGKPFYLSLSRSKSGSYSNNPRGIIFKLDGTKLNHKYKGFAIDYWGNSGFRHRSEGKSEMEDRIASANPEIPNARKYILEVIAWADEHSKSSIYSFYQQKVELLCKKLNIPFIFYNSYEDFIKNKNPHNSVEDVVDFSKIEKLDPYKTPRSFRKRDMDRVKYLLNFLLNLKDPEHNYDRYDSNIVIGSDYHNYIRRSYDKTSIYAKSLLAKTMKKFKLKNIDDLFKLRFRQINELTRYENDIKSINYKLNQYIKDLNSNVDKTFDDFYYDLKYFLGDDYQSVSKLYKMKNPQGIKEVFEKYENILKSKIDDILKTSMNIHLNPIEKKRINPPLNDVQI